MVELKGAKHEIFVSELFFNTKSKPVQGVDSISRQKHKKVFMVWT
jgi:hypothetical protein